MVVAADFPKPSWRFVLFLEPVKSKEFGNLDDDENERGPHPFDGVAAPEFFKAL
jgi:hypothetical protein